MQLVSKCYDFFKPMKSIRQKLGLEFTLRVMVSLALVWYLSIVTRQNDLHKVIIESVYAYNRSAAASERIRSLETPDEVVTNINDYHLAYFSALLRGFSRAIVLDIGVIENKGDPAIGLGQFILLARLNITVIFYCDYYCTAGQLEMARRVAADHSTDDVVVLCSGGGNFGGYPINDYWRVNIMRLFPRHKVFILPQSAWFHNKAHLNWTVREYSKHFDLTIILRDNDSYSFAKQNFRFNNILLASDMAIGIGRMRQFFPPLFDVIRLRRVDQERPKNGNRLYLPSNVTFHQTDWLLWATPKADNVLDSCYLRTVSALIFLQQGRLVVTDRLHGHILSLLLAKPHLVVDNSNGKINNFRNTWTRSIASVAQISANNDDIPNIYSRLFKNSPPLLAAGKNLLKQAREQGFS